jgi:hypothetical protein
MRYNLLLVGDSMKILSLIATEDFVTFTLPQHVALSESIQDCAQVKVIELTFYCGLKPRDDI